MSINLLELTEKALSNQLVVRIAGIIGVDEAGANKAVGSALPALFGGLIEKVSTPEGIGKLDSVVDQADDTIVDNIGEILDGADGGSDRLMAMGKELVGGLLGDSKADKMIDMVAGSSGLPKEGAGSLIGIITPIIFSLLGKQKKILGLDGAGLSKLLHGQKDFLKGGPAPATGSIKAVPLVVGSVADKIEDARESASSAVDSTAEKVEDAAAPVADAAAEKVEETKDAVSPVVGSVADKIEDARESASSAVDSAEEKIEDAAAPVADAAAEKIEETKDAVPPVVGSVADKIEDARESASSAVDSAEEKIEDAAAPVADAADEKVEETKDAVPPVVGSVADKIEDAREASSSEVDAASGKVDEAKGADSSAVGSAAGKAEEVKEVATQKADAVAGAASETTPVAAKSGGGFGKVLITILILGGLGFLGWKFVLPMLTGSSPSGGVTAPAEVTPANAVATMGGVISDAKSTFRKIKDVPSAEAAVPGIESMTSRVGAIAALAGSLPAPARQQLKKLVTDFAPQFTNQLEKLYGIPGVKAVLEPKVDELISKLEGFG